MLNIGDIEVITELEIRRRLIVPAHSNNSSTIKEQIINHEPKCSRINLKFRCNWLPRSTRNHEFTEDIVEIWKKIKDRQNDWTNSDSISLLASEPDYQLY